MAISCVWIFLLAILPPGLMRNLGFEECFPLSIVASAVTLFVAGRVISSQIWLVGKLALTLLLVLAQIAMWAVAFGEL